MRRDENGAPFEPMPGDRESGDHEGDKRYAIDQPLIPARPKPKAPRRAPAKPTSDPALSDGCGVWMLVCLGSLAALLVAVVLVAAVYMALRFRQAGQASAPHERPVARAAVIKLA